MTIQSKLLSEIPGLLHGFGSAEEPVARSFLVDWERLRPRWKQVHGARVVEVTAPAQACGETDALFTFLPGLPLGVVTADCVPILAARRDGRAVAAVHAGWRGTRARIAEALAGALEARGEKLSDWVAAIGPAIGPCCYEVSPELAADFAREFGEDFVRGRLLDLPAINAAQLARFSGVEVLRHCTRCEHRFFSHRRAMQEGETQGRQYSVIRSVPA